MTRVRTRPKRSLLLLTIVAVLTLGVSAVPPLGTSAEAVDVGDYSGATNIDPMWRVKPTDHFPDGETSETFQGPADRANCGPGSSSAAPTST